MPQRERKPVTIMPYSDGTFTVDQADDLAKYFFGPKAGAWAGQQVGRSYCLHYISVDGDSQRFIGANWTAALLRGGVLISDRLPELQEVS